MNINLNQTLVSLDDAYHAGKLTKDEYRIQRSIEFERLSVQAEKLSKKHLSNASSHSSLFKFSNKEKRKKHITLSVVLCVIAIFIFIALLTYY